MSASWLGPGPKRCLLPLPAAKDAGAARLPGLLASRQQLKHPSTLRMVIEALQAQDKKEGVSVTAIKQFILAKYPTVDPIRLKYLLKQALSKGLSSGVLMRPHRSTAVGATGSFKLAPKKQQRKKQQLGQEDSNDDKGQAPKLGQKRTTKLPRAPKADVQQRGAAEERPVAAKRKLKVPSMSAQPPAAGKIRRDKATLPRATGHPKASGKGRSESPEALADEGAGRGDGNSPVGARAKGPRKVPVGNSKGKVPKGAQQDVPKAKKGQGKARKPQAAAGAGRGEARLQKAVPSAVGRKAP
ncbi:histone H1.8 [Phaenicophaeus curvirostris]|uniref:histone H1.8 n=1 Tax=Phaenicophaeus curvirostris TaxID=33595 RepID=UPI0037F0DF42